ncbi:phage/plasmid primase, P4 family [Streptacidiphilus sp. EB103A]|uniref:DNA primase family protein n=1 Tax=Streptacidiphilus sp. EB103A TaxID=3156275 RepID=UPI003517621D
MTSATEALFDAPAAAAQMALLDDQGHLSDSPDPSGAEVPAQGQQTQIRLPRRLTERWNAELFVQLHGGTFRHVTDVGWYVWDGSRWSRGEGEKKALHTAGTLGAYIDRLNLAQRGFDKKAVDAHIRSSESTAGMKAMLTQAATFEEVSLEAEQMDSDPELLCTPGGIINLRTGEITPPDSRRDRHTRMTRVAPEKMPTPRWKNFLYDTFGQEREDQELINYLQILMGYSITGDVGAHVLPFLHGAGKNGKSVLLDTVVELMGDYAAVAPEGFLMTKPYAEHATELTELHGRRIMLCNEVKATDRFNEQRVKALTSSGDISARRMRKDFYTFKMTHHLWLIGNHKPEVPTGGDPAFWRRLRLVPFTRTVSEDRRVHNLAEKLVQEEGPGILAFLIEGAQRYLRNPDALEGPSIVRMATQEYAKTEDHVGRFIAEMCVRRPNDPAIRVLQPQLYLAYSDWWRDEGIGGQPSSQRAFHGRVRQDLGIKSPDDLPRSNGKKYYPGLGLKEDG